MQVNITWEDILQEEHNKGMFDMELEDLDEDEDNLRHEGTKVCPFLNFYWILDLVVLIATLLLICYFLN